MLYGLTDIARNMANLSSNSSRLRKNEFWSLDDVSFEIKKSESIGLIGANGSGKTTLLKLLNGIFWPDKGRISVRGNIGALIAVGAGFHPLLSGRENIYLNGAILGMGRREMKEKFDSIVDFSGIQNFLDTPVKFYSSGMFVRLGFAVAIHCDPDILLVDEVLAVGDINFQVKCINKMKELRQKGITTIYVSHDLNSVFLLCDKCIYLSKGRMLHFGETSVIINEYRKDSLAENAKPGTENRVRYGTKEIAIKQVGFLDHNGLPKTVFKRGESLLVKIRFEASGNIPKPEFSVGFSTEEGVLVSKATTRDHGFFIDHVSGVGEVRYTIRALPFNVGRYWVTIGSWDETGHIAYDHHEKLYEILIEDGLIANKIHERFGIVHVPAEWDISANGHPQGE